MLLVSLLLAVQQPVRITPLERPSASVAEPFSGVAGIRERSDGQVIILDNVEARIVQVNLRTGSMTPIGRPGRGPGEYTLPVALVALPGDTTLAPDMVGGGQALVITKDGAAGLPLRSARTPAGVPLFSRTDLHSDREGRLYELVTRVRRENGKILRIDSSAIRRIDRRRGLQDTIGQLSQLVRSPLIRPVSATRGANGPVGARSAGTMPPFASVDQWAVAPDGRIAFVSVSPYRVQFIDATGRSIDGPVLSYDRVPVNNALRQQWREQQGQPRMGLLYGPNGRISPTRSRSKVVEPTEWPDELPPFLRNAVRFAPDGTLWIERAVAAGQPATFDLINPQGAITRRVVLPRQTRLVGFGVDAVYTVRIDADDLEYLQKHPLPK